MNTKQQELKEWQDKNFPRSRYEVLSKEELIDMIIILQVTLGIAEESGEICHAVLKGTQGIREGINGIDKEAVADGVSDNFIYGMQLLSELKLKAEEEIPKVIDQVLERNWLENPEGVCSCCNGAGICLDIELNEGACLTCNGSGKG